MLTVLTQVPEGFIETAAADLHSVLAGPTLIHLPGRRPEPLFVSMLLHGDEDTGLKAAQQVLEKRLGHGLPRALSLFVGNVAAARARVRRLDHQPDYNRVWPGTEAGESAASRMAAQVVDEMRGRGVFASIDLHNNTGLNPHYACVARLEQRAVRLATLFSRTVIHFTRPLGTQTAAFAALCPAVAVECGKAGNPASEAAAAGFLEACLHLSDFPAHPLAAHDIDLYRSVGIVKVRDGITFSFATAEVDLLFHRELDHLNFCDLPAGTRFGTVHAGGLPLSVWDESGVDVAGRYFEIAGGELVTRVAVMPAMLTLSERAIRQDCLCYLMERMALDPAHAPAPRSAGRNAPEIPAA